MVNLPGSRTCRGNKGEELTTGPLPHWGSMWPQVVTVLKFQRWCAGLWRTCEGTNERTGSDEVQEMAEPAEARLTRFMSGDGERV